MKIGFSQEILRQYGSGQPPPGKDGTDAAFGKMLDDAMAGAAANSPAAAGTATITGTVPVGLHPMGPGAETPLVDRVENFLDTLDAYQQKLGDSRCALREIDPLVRQMETEAEKLMPAFRDLSDDDGLKAILDQTLITASLEIARFNRGDYIAGG